MTEEDVRTVAHFKGMLRIRRFEEKCAELYSLAKIRGFLHLYIGEEAVAIGCLAALRADDNVVASYREHGHALARGTPPGSIMAEMFGKTNGCSRGRGGSMHLFDVSRRFYGGYAIVSGGLPIAVGLALADKMQGRDGITACFFGDGAVDEGEFHESMNLAALWRLPVLLICENNLYAMGTALERHQSLTDLSTKPHAYGIESESVDGMDVFAVEVAARSGADQVRATGRPFFLEARTYRFRAHSMYDAELYRSKDEVRFWMNRHDPIAGCRARLRARGLLDETAEQAIEQEIADEIEGAVGEAEGGSFELVEDLERDLYAPEGR